MKTAIVIPVCDAIRRGVWRQVLDAAAQQEFHADERIVIDTGSTDGSAELAAEYGWRVIGIRRAEFDHGLTRDRIVRDLHRREFDTVIFLTQDVILASPLSLKRLVDYLYANPVAGCYGRQLGTRQGSLDSWQRECCYPDVSTNKSLADIPRLKLMTPFCSNAFSAWKIPEVIAHGGFVRTDFGEDMLLAAKVINDGGLIGYCAEATAFHDNPDSPAELFRRGVAIGGFHRRHPELLKQFGAPVNVLLRGWRRSVLLPLTVKSFGYVCGRFRDRLAPWSAFLLMWLLLLPAIALYDFPQRDVAMRYAPMAEAFAAGEWRFAFHPRVTPFLTVAAGMISWLFSCDGYWSCRLAGALFLTCGIFPLYWGCFDLYGFRTAFATALLYAGCSAFARFGCYGLREAAGVFGVAMLFHAATKLRERPSRFPGCLEFAAAEAVLLLTRGDLALFALAALIALGGWDLWRHRHPLRTLGVAAATAALILPVLVCNYRTIGYPVPEVRHAVVMRKLCSKVRWLKVLENPRPEVALDIGMPAAEGNDE